MKVYLDVKEDKAYTAEQIGYKFYASVSHEAFPTLKGFIEFCDVKNGGTLREMTQEELIVTDEEFLELMEFEEKYTYAERMRMKSPLKYEKFRIFTKEQEAFTDMMLLDQIKKMRAGMKRK